MSQPDLSQREFVRPREAVLLFGRSRHFWTDAFDQGIVDGYRQNSNGWRWLRTESCRSYLDRLCGRDGVPYRPDGQVDRAELVARAKRRLAERRQVG
jgi:hypothetical protein